jgi:threonine synthase
MEYVSTLDPSYSVSFTEAFMASQPHKSVGGLFVPKVMPELTPRELEETRSMKYHEIATLVNKKFIGDEIPEDELSDIMKKAYSFPMPFQKISDDMYLVWFSEGPTRSYKDAALAPVGLEYEYLLNVLDRSIFVDMSSTGDTAPGGISTMKNVSRGLVVVKYPSVTPWYQKLQMCTQGAIAIEYEAPFDFILDQQKKLSQDEDVKKAIGGDIATLNSTNHARIQNEIPYYIKFRNELMEEFGEDVKPIFSVPSGNYSNLTAGIYSKIMGLPVEKLIIASNSNNTVPRFLETGKYEPRSKVETLATAMDIARPNNFKRDVYFYGGVLDDDSAKILKMPDLAAMRKDLEGITISNTGIKRAMRRLHKEQGIFACPHSCVAQEAAFIYEKRNKPKQPIISFMTADPAKFADTVTKVLGVEPPIHKSLRELENKERRFYKINRRNVSDRTAYEIYKGIVLNAIEESELF